ncbi:ATP-binding protein [Streptomyces sp. NPDC088253]|uniref:ATP-binding protein n=1 Tax=Streptomyces sp. NPDC088253 TaxID=3365846 RepID=UPI0038033052
MAQLVGRTSEPARLDAVVHGLGQPGAPTAVDIAGEPGIGKSRLPGEVCARARQAGFTVLRGRAATEYEQHIPFHAFTDAFARAAPGHRPTMPSWRSGAGRRRLHWADPESRELVDYLVRHPPRGRVLLVVARRSRQGPRPLTAALTRGADNGAVLHVPWEPLPEQESIRALAPDLPRTRPGSCTPPARANPSIRSPWNSRSPSWWRSTAG